MTAWYEPLFKVLWYGHLPCFDVKGITSRYAGQKGVLQQCKWRGITVPCSAIFETYPTDRGMCCGFNMKKAETIFRSGAYVSMIKRMQDTDYARAFGISKKPKWYTDNREPRASAGQNKGLTVMLDSRTNFVSSGSVHEDFMGFTAYVDANRNFPLTMQKGIKIRPGFENNVAIRAFNVETSHDTIAITPDKRGCLFKTEHTLRLHNHYSQVFHFIH